MNEEIKNLIPKNKRQLQRIIGYLNWFRRFIPNFSEKILPLTEMLRREKILWTNYEKSVVEETFKEIKEAASLKFPNFNESFYLTCDASDKGISGCLYQNSGVLGYYSKRLTSTEERYSIVEKELYAIIKSLENFRELIQGFHIIIFTDNMNIIYHTKNITKRIHRWKVLMNEFNFDLKHISSKENTVADLLSRQFLIKANDECNELQNYSKNTENYLPLKFLLYCKKKNLNINYKDTECKARPIIRLLDDYTTNELKKYFHNKYGHAGISTTIKTLKYYFDFNNGNKLITNFIKQCKKCMECKFNYSPLTIKNKITSKEIWKAISSDIIGPIDTAKYKNDSNDEKIYIMTITDIYSRFTQLFFIYNINSTEVSKAFKTWFKTYKEPQYVITDNGRQYVSKKLKKLFNENKIKHTLIPSYTPSSNGISERINRTINEVLRITKRKSLSEIKKILIRRLNFTYNHSIKSIPHHVINGDEKVYFNPSEDNIGTSKFKIKIGDQIYIRNFKNKDKEDNLFNGPYVITEIGKKGNWVKVGDGSEWYHVKNIKRFGEGRM